MIYETVRKASKQYRRDIYSTEYDHKPSIDKIVNFVL